ncbi:odorant receptor Or2-like [Colletes latitarsis]|uniref:odorant receptor Or2-like n=1 Tax=Colletes latitarsis TaxID=2605962 RepID=UPI004035EF14
MFTSIVTLTGHGAILGYVVTPLIDNIGQNKSERALPFNFYLNLPLTETPYYEVTFIVQVAILYPVAICFFCFDNMLCIINVHVSGQFRILQYRLTNLYRTTDDIMAQNGNTSLTINMDNCYEKMKACVQQHQMLIDYCLKIENVFTVTILAQVLIFSVLICLFGYQVLMMNSSIAKRSIFVFLIIGSMVLLFMFTYSCHILMEQSDNIGTAAYSALWTLMPMQGNGRTLRHGLMMIITRSQKVCCLTANGFFPISLETYSTVLSTAVSYFMLLSQSFETTES